MHNKTNKLKSDIQKIESIQERLELLKDQYKDDTVYIVTCGPSLQKHDLKELKSKLKNKLVFSIKQAYNILKEETDFHLLNTIYLSMNGLIIQLYIGHYQNHMRMNNCKG